MYYACHSARVACTSECCLMHTRYSLAIYSVDTASNVQRVGPYTVVVGAGIFSASIPAASSCSPACFAGSAVVWILLLSVMLCGV